MPIGVSVDKGHLTLFIFETKNIYKELNFNFIFDLFYLFKFVQNIIKLMLSSKDSMRKKMINTSVYELCILQPIPAARRTTSISSLRSTTWSRSILMQTVPT